MIYDAGSPLVLRSLINDADEFRRVAGRKPRKSEVERMDGLTTYCAAVWADEPQGKPFVVDCALLRADGGFKEIQEAVARIACEPKREAQP